MPNAIIFDWDDTLAQTRPAVTKAIEYVLKKYNQPSWEITKATRRDSGKSFKENFPNFFGADAPEAYRDYLTYYEAFCYNEVAPAKSAKDFLLLCQQKNIDLYIVSNKEKSLLLKEVAFCFPNIKFKQILGNGDAPHNKPAPDAVFKALKDAPFPINQETTWLVGDSKQDTDCAYNAKIQPILIGAGKFMTESYIKSLATTSIPLLHFADFAELLAYTTQKTAL